jgi:hypothetical protein
MVNEERLQIVISASDQASPALKAVAGNTKAIGEAAKQTDQVTGTAFGRMSGYVEQHKQTIQTVGLAMTAVGAITVAVADKCIAAYNEQADAVARLDAAFRSSGQAVGSIGLEKLASDLQKVTPFADEATLAMMGTLASMGFTEDQIISLTPRVQNLSVAFGKDLTSTAQALGRAILMQSAGPLTRFGIIIDENALKSGNLSDVLAALDTNTKGMAESAGKAGSGPMKIFHNELGEISESIGKALVPSLQIANKVLTPVVELITKVADTKAGQTLIAVATGAGIAVGGFGALVTIAAPVVLGIAAIKKALIEVAITSRATAATVAASSAEMAAATTAAGAAAGGGAAISGAGAAAGGATAALGLRALLGRGARAAGRFVAGKTALGAAGPIGGAAAIGLTGYEIYAARKQAAAEQQIADIESGATETPGQKALIASNMARWKATRAAQPAGIAPGMMAEGIAGAAPDIAAITKELGADVGQQIVEGYKQATPPLTASIAKELADSIATAVTAAAGSPGAAAPAIAAISSALGTHIGPETIVGGYQQAIAKELAANLVTTVTPAAAGPATSLPKIGILPGGAEPATKSSMVWDEKNRRFVRRVVSPEVSGPLAVGAEVAGMTKLGGGAWQLGQANEPGYVGARRGWSKPSAGSAGRLSRAQVNAEGVIVDERPLPDGGRELIFRVLLASGVPSPGLFTDGVTDWMTDLQYADAGAL